MGMTTTTGRGRTPQDHVHQRRVLHTEQIWRDGDVAVYEYNSRGGSFEVVISTSGTREGLSLASCAQGTRCHPTTTQWGTYGWSFGPTGQGDSVKCG